MRRAAVRQPFASQMRSNASTNTRPPFTRWNSTDPCSAQTQIETGVVGDQFTEITGGLNDGEQIVIPTVRAATSGSGTNRGTGTGTGGFGGGRVGSGG